MPPSPRKGRRRQIKSHPAEAPGGQSLRPAGGGPWLATRREWKDRAAIRPQHRLGAAALRRIGQHFQCAALLGCNGVGWVTHRYSRTQSPGPSQVETRSARPRPRIVGRRATRSSPIHKRVRHAAPRRRADGPSGSDHINRATGALYFELSR
jgi:hypothetical protein